MGLVEYTVFGALGRSYAASFFCSDSWPGNGAGLQSWSGGWSAGLHPVAVLGLSVLAEGLSGHPPTALGGCRPSSLGDASGVVAYTVRGGGDVEPLKSQVGW